MSDKDPELTALLVLELGRHLATLERDPPDLAQSARALHALKGSAGLAGETDLAAEIAHLERRAREPEILQAAAQLVRLARDRLAAGQSALAASWPQPPPHLAAQALAPDLRAQYIAESLDRLASIDEALGGTSDPDEAVRTVYRNLHTMKGAASAVGDEPMAWFCHGLEERVRDAAGPDAPRALAEVSRWRAALGGLLDDPEAALGMLRGTPTPARPTGAPRSTRPDADEVGPRSMPVEGTIRIASLAVDRALERVAGAARGLDALAAAEAERQRASQVRELRSELRAALRLIGPPRPWGAPAAAIRRVDGVAAALGPLAESLDAASNAQRTGTQALRDGLGAVQRDLFAMREAHLKSLFARLASAIEAEARRSGREIVVRTSGAEETVGRRVLEQLAEPCLQLARNAVAHGIELPRVRAAMGKPRAGTIAIGAHKRGTRLRLTIEDDGAGVDVAALRAAAVARGAVPARVAGLADDDTLLGLLFLPGFSLHGAADVLAGRGIGLDIVLAAVQRMAGVIHVSSTRGVGFRMELEVPIESGLGRILWVSAGGASYGLLASHVRRVGPTGDGALATLAACLDPSSAPGPAVRTVELDIPGPQVRIGVDAVGQPTEELVRPPTPIIAALGPFVGVVVRHGAGSGSEKTHGACSGSEKTQDPAPALVLDAYTVASRALALASIRA